MWKIDSRQSKTVDLIPHFAHPLLCLKEGQRKVGPRGLARVTCLVDMGGCTT